MIRLVVMDTIKEALTVTGAVCTPVMAAVLAVGLIVAVFQAATQINEQSLSLIPKLVIIFFIVMFMGSYLLDTLESFFKEILIMLPTLVQ
ncbi:flagellar biosynthetic protein FliQ [Photobacterium kishitanii]|uniref:Flagellar biosynthetic protein FliQ n=1 Tax=Photobacterium kishitanii TaxID=318456 RepID=A0A2T3KMU1_9GAMM|nr:flagellar biosynthetic protein FliQ [Photobacterium kishitanii]PSV01127.1 hypothetical protein C9J27_03650 [Photobacterium kishitanii]